MTTTKQLLTEQIQDEKKAQAEYNELLISKKLTKSDRVTIRKIANQERKHKLALVRIRSRVR